ncbi:FAD-dependent oxidoreductase [uncultured Erythrobacter sp.]|uniref:NAD(P)/FAD-dependent oxidoreductase n=1 Tax=uncultured Erythrobacter sp. TaxID=263913 RepID=UPI00260BFE5D|nr:FAD-dependent oxidoreductase [uncultured Erythrobacter sp.]
MTAISYDFAIIGAGMAGASLAAELGPFAKVLLLEAEDVPGYHSTGRSAAFWEECYGGPGIVPLTLPSGNFLREHGFLRRRGALYVGRQEDGPKLDDFERRFAGTGVTIERVDGMAARAHVPFLRDEWCDGIYEQACADIDVAGLHQFYLKALKNAGVELKCRARVLHLERGQGGWRILTTNGDTYHATQIVNAAGAWADTIARIAGAQPLGITPFRRTVAQLRVGQEAPEDMPLVLDISGNFYFKSDNGRIWLSPHDETPTDPCDAAPEEIDVAKAINQFERATSWRIEAVERRWAGLRSFTPDRLPVYGADPLVPGLQWFAGQGGFGIQTAPAAARVASQAMLGLGRDDLTSDIDAKVYDPSRFYREKAASAI